MNVLFLILTIGCFLLNLEAPVDLSTVNKFVLCVEFISVLVISRNIIKYVAKPVDIIYKEKLFNAFLLFFALSMLYLHFCWTPYLSYNINDFWGFDPQRYYYYASQILESPDFEFGLNYTGVVYIYVFIMGVFGVDPLIPLFINVLLVVLTISMLTYFLFVTYGNTRAYKYTWLFFFFPEIIYFSVLSSREIFCLVFVSLSVYIVAMHKENKKDLMKILLLIFGVFLVRPPLAVALVLSLILSSLKQKKNNMKYGIIVLLFCLFYGVIDYGSQNGTADMIDSLSSHVSGNVRASDDFNYSENSIARKLIPSNPIEFVVFGVIRSLLYLIPRSNPIDAISASFLLSYKVGDLLVWISTFIMMFSIPTLWHVMLGLKKIDNSTKVVFISFGVFFLIVGALNTNLIQERYRIVYDFLLLTVWLLAKQKCIFKKSDRHRNISNLE